MFIDPPYDSRLLGPALCAAERVVSAGGMVYAESADELGAEAIGGLLPFRSARAGAVHFHLLRKAAAVASVAPRDS